MMNYHP